MRANLIGHINDAHAALPVFLRQGHGVFVNMISLGGFAATPFAAAYSASKFGLRGFAEALRAELRDHPGVRICDVYPAFVDTPGLRHGANYVGKALSAPPPVADARTVARAVVRLADRPKATTIVGSVAWLVRLAHALAPDLTAAAMARFMRAYFRRAAPTRMSDGNLFAPPAIAGGIDGGLRANAPSHALLAAGAIVLGAGCLALLLARSRA